MHIEQHNTLQQEYISPFQLMFGRQPHSSPFKPPTHETLIRLSYTVELQAKLAHLQDLVHANLASAAQNQKLHYDNHSKTTTFQPGDPVWLSVPTSGILKPKWQGNWTVVEVKTPINLKITNRTSTKVVHT